MTVDELIEHLADFGGDTPVNVITSEGYKHDLYLVYDSHIGAVVIDAE